MPQVERKLSDSSSNRPAPQQPSKQHLASQGIPPRAHCQTLKRPPASEGPPKVETLHWKDTPRRDRRASLPSGVKLLENSSPRVVLDVAVEIGKLIWLLSRCPIAQPSKILHNLFFIIILNLTFPSSTTKPHLINKNLESYESPIQSA